MLTCPKCGSNTIYLKENGGQTGAFCTVCDRWIKWVGKKERDSADLVKQIEASSQANLEKFKANQAVNNIQSMTSASTASNTPTVEAVMAASADLFKPTSIEIGVQSNMVEHTETPLRTTTTYQHPDCKHFEFSDDLNIRVVDGSNVVFVGELAYVAPQGGYLRLKPDGLVVYDKNLCLAATFKRV